MTEQQQAKFDGFAIVDVMGHQRYAGYVTTEAYGSAVLFRIDVPPLEDRERVAKRAGYTGSVYYPAGSVLKELGTQGYSKLIGAGSIYSITPCTQEACMAAVEEIQPRPLQLVSLPAEKAIAAGTPADLAPETGFDCCAGNVADGHELDCPSMDDTDGPEDDE